MEELSERETLANIKFSPIHLNHSTISSPHTDDNLEGYPSIAMGFGDSEGGRLKVSKLRDMIPSTSVEERVCLMG